MEPERRQRRRKDRKEALGAEPTRSIHDVSDDLLWRILLCLDSPIWLIRAACACKRWRRVVNGDGADEGRVFLLLASSLHPRPVVGQYQKPSRGNHLPRFVPSSSHIDSRRFSVDFLEKDWGWYVADCHGGLVLLGTSCTPYTRSVPIFRVYDPLTRQRRQIFPLHPSKNRIYNYGTIRDAFLLNGEHGNISISNFRVLYRCRWQFSNVNADDADLKPCVFSTASGDCRFLNTPDNDQFPSSNTSGHVAGRVDGSLYVGFHMGCITAIDNTNLEFSKVSLPIGLNKLETPHSSTFTVVHGAGLGPASIVHVRGEELQLFRQVHDRGEWVLEHSIANLSEATHGLSVCLKNCREMEWSTMVAVITDGTAFAVLSAYSCRGDYDSGYNKRWFFSIDVNTMALRLLPEELYRRDTNLIFNYTLPWPQVFKA